MNIITKISETIVDVFYNLKRSKRKFASDKAQFIFIHDNGDEEIHTGVITADRNFAYCPSLELAKVYPITHKDERGNLKIYVPETRGNLNYKTLKNIAKSKKYDAYIKFKDHTDRYYIHEFKATGCLDFTLLKNDFTADFDTATYKVTQTTGLNLLKEMPNWKFILGLLMALFLGMVIGFVGNQLFNIVLILIPMFFGGGG